MKTINGYTFFWKDKLAQWNMTPFEDEYGFVYNCAEQYMMAEKARLFEDFGTLESILVSKSPREQQELGREIENFNQEIWEKHRENIVYKGNIFKFSQNKKLRDILFSTGDTILVEASPYDRIWGVGLSEDNPLILDEQNWRGLNLLGKTLMRVRDTLKNKFSE